MALLQQHVFECGGACRDLVTYAPCESLVVGGGVCRRLPCGAHLRAASPLPRRDAHRLDPAAALINRTPPRSAWLLRMLPWLVLGCNLLWPGSSARRGVALGSFILLENGKRRHNTMQQSTPSSIAPSDAQMGLRAAPAAVLQPRLTRGDDEEAEAPILVTHAEEFAHRA